jgi:Protein of unknown function (DUF3037)
MSELRKLEFFLLRYVPDAVKGEFVNVGVMVVEPERNGSGFAEVRFTRDWRRVQCLDPQADVEWLAAVEKDIRSWVLEAGADQSVLLKKLDESLSNGLQLSAAKGCLAEDPVKEMEQLVQLYLQPVQAPETKRELSGRQKVLGRMRKAFEDAGVLPLMIQNFAVAKYTKSGDPMKLDFAYSVGSAMKFLHAVSLRAGVEQAVVLAARFPDVAAGLQSKRDARAMLTAVVDDGFDGSRDEVGFALAMMHEKGVVVAEVGEMARIAEEVRVELRA